MITNLTFQVGEILKDYPETRNSDIALMIELWKTYYPNRVKKGANGELGVWLKDLYDLPREDAIKRIRAHYQNDLNRYLPTSLDVVIQRRINQEKWREYMSLMTEHKRI